MIIYHAAEKTGKFLSTTMQCMKDKALRQITRLKFFGSDCGNFNFLFFFSYIYRKRAWFWYNFVDLQWTKSFKAFKYTRGTKIVFLRFNNVSRVGLTFWYGFGKKSLFVGKENWGGEKSFDKKYHKCFYILGKFNHGPNLDKKYKS